MIDGAVGDVGVGVMPTGRDGYERPDDDVGLGDVDPLLELL
jgi:hypothetical protein